MKTDTNLQESLLITINLRSEVVSERAGVLNCVFDNDGHVLSHTDLDGRGNRGGFCEHGEVAEGEVQLDRLLHLNDDGLVGVVDAGGWLQGDITVTEVAGSREFDSFFGTANGAGVTDDLHITANSLELCGGHRNDGLVK